MVIEQKGTFRSLCSSKELQVKSNTGQETVMNTKSPIRVIKRHNRQQASTQNTAATNATTTKKTAQEAARDVVSTVTEWVNEFQQKRRTETKQAIKQLFSEPTPRPSEA